MYEVARATINERRALFRNTSQKMNVHEAIIEKDFWVCITLDYLFQRCLYKNRFAFKGGTCLSKAYNLIQAFFGGERFELSETLTVHTISGIEIDKYLLITLYGNESGYL